MVEVFVHSYWVVGISCGRGLPLGLIIIRRQLRWRLVVALLLSESSYFQNTKGCLLSPIIGAQRQHLRSVSNSLVIQTAVLGSTLQQLELGRNLLGGPRSGVRYIIDPDSEGGWPRTWLVQGADRRGKVIPSRAKDARLARSATYVATRCSHNVETVRNTIAAAIIWTCPQQGKITSKGLSLLTS